MRRLSIAALLLLVTGAIPVAADAAGAPPTGFRFERSIYADAVDGALRSPEGVACDERGAVVVADTGNARLVTYRWKDGALEGGKQVRLAQLTYPVRVQVDSKGFVLALDGRTHRIVRVDENGAFAGYLDPAGASSPVTPLSFKLGPDDGAYILDVVARKVTVVAPGGRVTRELPLPSGKGFADVAVDSAGRVYVVDAVTSTVFEADRDASEFHPVSKSLKDMISFPGYLAPDNRGKLYVVDEHGNAVVKLGLDGTVQGRELALGRAEGGVFYPGQLCLGAGGDVFLADRGNDRVDIFSVPR